MGGGGRPMCKEMKSRPVLSVWGGTMNSHENGYVFYPVILNLKKWESEFYLLKPRSSVRGTAANNGVIRTQWSEWLLRRESEGLISKTQLL